MGSADSSERDPMVVPGNPNIVEEVQINTDENEKGRSLASSSNEDDVAPTMKKKTNVSEDDEDFFSKIFIAVKTQHYVENSGCT